MADLTITAANVRNESAATEQGTWGATGTAGQVVYQDPADGKYKLADANSATPAVRVPRGIALNSGADGQPVLVALRGGLVNVGATLTVGEVYVASATPGGIAPVADLASGHYTCVLGVATATNRLRLEPIHAGAPRA